MGRQGVSMKLLKINRTFLMIVALFVYHVKATYGCFDSFSFYHHGAENRTFVLLSYKADGTEISKHLDNFKTLIKGLRKEKVDPNFCKIAILMDKRNVKPGSFEFYLSQILTWSKYNYDPFPEKTLNHDALALAYSTLREQTLDEEALLRACQEKMQWTRLALTIGAVLEFPVAFLIVPNIRTESGALPALVKRVIPPTEMSGYKEVHLMPKTIPQKKLFQQFFSAISSVVGKGKAASRMKKQSFQLTEGKSGFLRGNLLSVQPGCIQAVQHCVLDGRETMIVSPANYCFFCKKKDTSLKKCGKCKAARYCSQDCQARDWGKHKQDCNKYVEHTCESCPTLVVDNTSVCQLCGAARYCSMRCQKAHNKECTAQAVD
jgi:hypothetical protein